MFGFAGAALGRGDGVGGSGLGTSVELASVGAVVKVGAAVVIFVTFALAAECCAAAFSSITVEVGSAPAAAALPAAGSAVGLDSLSRMRLIPITAAKVKRTRAPSAAAKAAQIRSRGVRAAGAAEGPG